MARSTMTTMAGIKDSGGNDIKVPVSGKFDELTTTPSVVEDADMERVTSVAPAATFRSRWKRGG